MTLTRDDVLSACARPLPCESIEVPEFGGTVFVQGMSGKARDAFEMRIAQGRHKTTPPSNVRASLVVQCLVDQDQRRLCSDDDVAAVGEMRADVLDRLYTIAQRLSGFTADVVAVVQETR